MSAITKSYVGEDLGDTVPCESFESTPGGAWAWCEHCGVRADLHPGSGKKGEAVARIVSR